MEQIGINSNVFAGGKVFHIQTAGNPVGLSIQTEIFDAGRIVAVQRHKLDQGPGKVSHDRFKDILAEFHQEISWELELLFYMRDKIHNVKHPLSHYKLGALFLHKGLDEDAATEFRLAIEKNSQMAEAHNGLGLSFLKKGKYADAESSFRYALTIQPGYADMHHNLGLVLAKMGKFDESLKSFEAALQINPKYGAAQLGLSTTLLEHASVHRRNGGSEKSEKLEARALELIRLFVQESTDPADNRFFTYRRDKIVKHVQTGEMDLAVDVIKEIKEALQEPALDETVHGFYLKFLFGGAGKDEAVLNDYRHKLEKVASEKPEFADLRNSLGMVYLIQCRNLFIQAMNEFRKAYEINPNYKNAYKNFRLVQNDGREFLNLLRAILK
ncbi:MAG: tetratricopeptide repeat protein [Bacteroidetes bacterium]|nr:tetratricopeptide repeat protein [Bacteroidota bacterium]